MIEDLSNPVSDIRRKAAYELVNQGNTAVEPIHRALTPGSDRLRYISAQILGRIGNPRSAPVLLALTHDANLHVRKNAILALSKIHVPTMKDTLLHILRHNPQAELRAIAAEGLPNFRDTSVVKSLCSALGDSIAIVRQSAIAALGRIWTGSAIPTVIAAIQDPDEKVRYIAVQVAANHQLAAARLPLRRMLADNSIWVRTEAARGLALLSDTTAVEALVALMKERYEGADVDAARAALQELTGVDYIID